MALLTTKGIYGIQAILEIVNASEISPISIKEISQRSKISRGYLEQILNSLRNANIISSIKGKSGGYYLSKSLDEITFYELFSTLEKDLDMTNIEIKNSALNLYFKQCNDKIKELLSTPLSEISKFESQSTKYLNFVI
ncbi:MAG: Rrf2 family transcriptional regulator [Campylobacter sp.]|nr:Rrf2 family transcriptional regulator [Campylobacter sp.]